MRRRKAGAGSMATTSCPSSFKVSGSPTGSKSPPTQRRRNPKPPPPDPSGHHQDSAIALAAVADTDLLAQVRGLLVVNRTCDLKDCAKAERKYCTLVRVICTGPGY